MVIRSSKQVYLLVIGAAVEDSDFTDSSFAVTTAGMNASIPIRSMMLLIRQL